MDIASVVGFVVPSLALVVVLPGVVELSTVVVDATVVGLLEQSLGGLMFSGRLHVSMLGSQIVPSEQLK